jgi:hypothetical protein
VPLASIIDPALAVLRDLNLEVQSTERILTSRLGYAGTSDMLATKDGLPIIVDYKTKKTEEGEPIVPTLNRKCRLRPIGMRPSPSGLIPPWVVATSSSAHRAGKGGGSLVRQRGARGRLGDLQGLPRSVEAGQEIRERLVNPKT